MSFLTNLTSAFKGGGQSRVPVASGYVSPWATAFDAGPSGQRSFEYASAVNDAYLANAPTVDLDQVPALSEDREKLWSQVSGADFLSEDEKRAMLGLQPKEKSQ